MRISRLLDKTLQSLVCFLLKPKTKNHGGGTGNEFTKLQVNQSLLDRSGQGAAQTEGGNTQTEQNLRFRGEKKNLSFTQLATSTCTDTALVRGNEGVISVVGPVVLKRCIHHLREAFKVRPPAQGRDFRVDAARPTKMATIVKPWAAIRVRIMSWERWLCPRWKQ